MKICFSRTQVWAAGAVFIVLILVCIVTSVLLVLQLLHPHVQSSYLTPCGTGKLAHAIYMPWDRETQQLKTNQEDFDHTWINTVQQRFPDWTWTLWSHDALRGLLSRHYPEWHQAIQQKPFPRPTMFVDLMRWVVVYHFGGVYVQHASELKQAPDALVPKPPHRVTLFTEVVLDAKQCADGAKYKIRQGVPEEAVRVANQAFGAVPKHPFLKSLIQFCVDRHCMYDVSEDYDVLFIAANAAVSTFWNQTHDEYKDVHLMSTNDRDKIIKFSTFGSWRTDKKAL